MQSPLFFLANARTSSDCRLGFAMTALAIALVGPVCTKPPQERCETSGSGRTFSTAVELCGACPNQERLCTTGPRSLASAYRIYEPAIAWTGEELGVAWAAMPDSNTGPGIRFASVTARGEILRETVLSRSMGELGPNVAWTGTAFGVTWGPPIFFDAKPAPDPPGEPIVAVVGADGSLLDPEANALELGMREGGKLAWNGAEYAIAWSSEVQLWLSRATADGQRLGDDEPLRQWASHSAIAWNGAEFTVAWSELTPPDQAPTPRENTLRVLELGNSKPGEEPTILEDPVGRPNPRSIAVHALLWTGQDYALLWTEENDLHANGLYLARVTPGSLQVERTTIVSQASGTHWHPSVAWTGKAFVVAWSEKTGDLRRDVFVASYTPELARSAGPIQVSAGTGVAHSTSSTTPSLAVANDLVLLLWSSNDESAIDCPTSKEVLAFAQVAICE